MYWTVEAFHPKDVTKYEGKILHLLTPTEYKRLPDGTTVISIFGIEQVKGRGFIDTDTRGGYMAYGTLAEDD